MVVVVSGVVDGSGKDVGGVSVRSADMVIRDKEVV